MAFSFVVEDGTGLSNATSYVSVAEADDYYTIDANFSAAWGALNSTQKEYRLAWAARILDQKVDWAGEKHVEDSGLRWPRDCVVDRDGIEIDDDVVPRQVKEATLEFAKYLQENDPTVGADVDWIDFMKIDVLELRFQKGTSQNAFPSIINQILAPLGFMRIGSSRSLKILKV